MKKTCQNCRYFNNISLECYFEKDCINNGAFRSNKKSLTELLEMLPKTLIIGEENFSLVCLWGENDTVDIFYEYRNKIRFRHLYCTKSLKKAVKKMLKKLESENLITNKENNK